MEPFVLENIGELITNMGLARRGDARGVEEADLAIQHGAWLAVSGGKVQSFGTGDVPTAQAGWRRVNARGALVLPGLIDAHTHPIWGGSRVAEFFQRLSGKTYQDIAAAGGGIKSSVAATRAAGDEELLYGCRQRLQGMLRWGVTTVEVKSGYGLSVRDELRLLRLLRHIANEGPQTLSVTCLALHAVPGEFSSARDYAAVIAAELLPTAVEERLADGVDMFIENGYFSAADCEKYVEIAQNHRLAIRVHADEFSDSGAARAAAQWRALSADHLQCASADGIRAMADVGVTAVILPGTSVYTKLPFTDGRRLAEAGCAVAIASDFNPGSCLIANLPFCVSLAAVQCSLSPAQAVAGATFAAAKSLQLGHAKGALAPGYDADFVVTAQDSLAAWLADFGQTSPESVWIAGACAHRRGDDGSEAGRGC